jgi:NitT/TauT family transport system permease protein/sulfonate transport system permease protein
VGRTARLRLGGFAVLVLLLVLWEVTSRAGVVNQIYVPPVSKIASELWRLLMNGELLRNLGASAVRFGFGYGLAVAIGLGIGLAMGYFRAGYLLLEPLIELLRPLPPPAIIPIAILFLGIENQMKVFVITFACFFPIVVNTIQGVAGVDRVLLDTARTFGLTTREIIWKIVLPSASPNIVAGMRIALAIALILTVISEMVASNDGIGFMILDMERAFRIPEMYAGIFTLMVVGYLLNRLFVAFESRTLAWYFGQSPRAQE